MSANERNSFRCGLAWTGRPNRKNKARCLSGDRSLSLTSGQQPSKFIATKGKRVELPQHWFGTLTWPPFHLFG